MTTESGITNLPVECGGCLVELKAQVVNGILVVEPCETCRRTYYNDGFEDGVSEGSALHVRKESHE